jgi:hypothetical protein
MKMEMEMYIRQYKGYLNSFLIYTIVGWFRCDFKVMQCSLVRVVVCLPPAIIRLQLLLLHKPTNNTSCTVPALHLSIHT